MFVFVLLCITLCCGNKKECQDHLQEAESKLVALILLSYECPVTINALRLFLMVPCVGLRCVIVVFPDHTHLLFKVGPSTKLSYAMGSLGW